MVASDNDIMVASVCLHGAKQPLHPHLLLTELPTFQEWLGQSRPDFGPISQLCPGLSDLVASRNVPDYSSIVLYHHVGVWHKHKLSILAVCICYLFVGMVVHV